MKRNWLTGLVLSLAVLLASGSRNVAHATPGACKPVKACEPVKLAPPPVPACQPVKIVTPPVPACQPVKIVTPPPPACKPVKTCDPVKEKLGRLAGHPHLVAVLHTPKRLVAHVLGRDTGVIYVDADSQPSLAPTEATPPAPAPNRPKTPAPPAPASAPAPATKA